MTAFNLMSHLDGRVPASLLKPTFDMDKFELDVADFREVLAELRKQQAAQKVFYLFTVPCNPDELLEILRRVIPVGWHCEISREIPPQLLGKKHHSPETTVVVAQRKASNELF